MKENFRENNSSVDSSIKSFPSHLNYRMVVSNVIRLAAVCKAEDSRDSNGPDSSSYHDCRGY